VENNVFRIKEPYMPFITKEQHLVTDGFTAVDNKFLLNYLADAPNKCVAVYLTGLMLADISGADNSPATIASKLSMEEAEVKDAYFYWQELGLVHIVETTPYEVVYLSVRDSYSVLKKIKHNKYETFAREIQRVIDGRLISTTEYNEYYLFLENTTFEWRALIAVAEYCKELKGNNISYQYILTVCRNNMMKGATTLAAVKENLSSQSKFDPDLKIVFAALKLARRFEYDDREKYEKWTRDFGFTLDTIAAVAKTVKTGGVTTLDNRLCEYFRAGVLSTAEIDSYTAEKLKLYDLAKAVTKNIGVYYQSLDAVIEEYIAPWKRWGFDDDALYVVSKYCFKNGTRTLAGLNDIIARFYKLGITTTDAIDSYITTVAKTDAEIQEILDILGIVRKVNSADRKLFTTWVSGWGLSVELIKHGAQQALGAFNGIQYLNKVLLNYKNSNITTVEQAAKLPAVAATVAPKKATEIEKHSYTDEQLNAMLNTLSDVDI
jgi:DNA replication protein DnaD